jgi:hypothetical protein
MKKKKEKKDNKDINLINLNRLRIYFISSVRKKNQ